MSDKPQAYRADYAQSCTMVKKTISHNILGSHENKSLLINNSVLIHKNISCIIFLIHSTHTLNIHNTHTHTLTHTYPHTHTHTQTTHTHTRTHTHHTHTHTHTTHFYYMIFYLTPALILCSEKVMLELDTEADWKQKVKFSHGCMQSCFLYFRFCNRLSHYEFPAEGKDVCICPLTVANKLQECRND